MSAMDNGSESFSSKMIKDDSIQNWIHIQSKCWFLKLNYSNEFASSHTNATNKTPNSVKDIETKKVREREREKV